MTRKRIVTATINGRAVSLAVDNRMSLLDALREAAGLTGAKEGCLTGDCGACSVIMNGRVVDSCLVMAAEAEGATLTTVEGIANGNQLHPLQKQFLRHAALQCGVCTPGFLVSAKALLDTTPNPTEHEIRYWMAGNLCRCTGYEKILSAVQDAAAELRNAKG